MTLFFSENEEPMNNDTNKKKVKIMTLIFFNDKEESMNNDTFLTNANVNIVQDTRSAESRHFLYTYA